MYNSVYTHACTLAESVFCGQELVPAAVPFSLSLFLSFFFFFFFFVCELKYP